MKTGHIVLDLRKIADRCEEEGDCLIWQQGVNSHGIPFAQHNGRQQSIRRLVYQLAKGVELDGSILAIVKCGNSRCLNDGHILALSRGAFTRRMAKAGKMGVNSACDRRRIAAQNRPSNKINAAIAAQIRAASGSQMERAQQFGVSQSLVAKIDRGVCWAPLAAGSSIFNWVPA